MPTPHTVASARPLLPTPCIDASMPSCLHALIGPNGSSPLRMAADLRAEIMHQAGVLPFESTRAALERARDAADGDRDLLRTVRDVLHQAVRYKGRNWLNVYGKKYAKKEIDGLGRAVWYRGERGQLPSTLFEADGAWDSLFIARLPEKLSREGLAALCSPFGAVDHVMCNPRRGYAFVRFERTEAASAALKALNGTRIFGATLAVRYKRRLRKVTSAPGHVESADLRRSPGHVESAGPGLSAGSLSELSGRCVHADDEEEVGGAVAFKPSPSSLMPPPESLCSLLLRTSVCSLT